jgi:hypothetical protein
LDDWRAQCLDWCHDRLEPTRYADQKYLDAWPEKLGAALLVLPHPGVNLAPWNWAGSAMELSGGGVRVDREALVLFHFARFDIAMFRRYLKVDCKPVYCTKIASKLVRTYTDKHGLKDLVRELLGVDISKEQQSSDWGARELSEKQLSYAAGDVADLHQLKTVLDTMLAREGRTHLAQACFDFLPARAGLDLAGWDDVDIFAH